MKNKVTKILAGIYDFLRITEIVVLLSFLFFEIALWVTALTAVDLKQAEYGQVLNECHYYSTPDFARRPKEVNGVSNPVEKELANRVEKHKKDSMLPYSRKSKLVNVKLPTPKPEDHIDIKSVDVLDTHAIKEMIQRHNGKIKITKQKDSV